MIVKTRWGKLKLKNHEVYTQMVKTEISKPKRQNHRRNKIEMEDDDEETSIVIPY